MKNSISAPVRREIAARQECIKSSRNAVKSTETDQNRLLNWVICSFIAAAAITVTVWVIVAPSNSY